MVYIYAFLLVVIIMFSFSKFKKWLNIVSIFTGIWFVFGMISTFGLFGLRIPSSEVHSYAITFVVVVDIVLFLFCKTGTKIELKTEAIQHESLIESHAENVKLQKSSGATIIQVLALLFLFPLLSQAITIFIQTQSLDAIRASYYDESYASQYIFNLLCRQMPQGFMNGLIVYYTYSSFVYERKKYLLYAALNALIILVVNGGRYSLFQLLYSLLIISISIGDVVKSQTLVWIKKYKKYIILVCALIVWVGFSITVSYRGGSFINGLVTYFSGSLSFLDYILTYPKMFALDERLNGYMTFGAITEPVVLLLKQLGFTDAKTPTWQFNVYCQEFYNIAQNTKYNYISFNNNTSVIYYFLRDFGYAGIYIGGIYLGGLTAFFYNRWKKGSMVCGWCYVYMGIILLNSLMTYQLFDTTPFFTFFTFWFCGKNMKKDTIKI